MSDSLLPDIFGAKSDSTPLPSIGVYPPRLLVSHGKEDGALSEAWKKYGSLEQGDLVIQNEGSYYRAEGHDKWFILPQTAFIFAGNRDPWTKELQCASRDLANCAKGGTMAKQICVTAIWVPSKRDVEEVPEVLAVYVSMEKARTNGPLSLIESLDRLSRAEEPTPPALRAYANFYGKLHNTKPNAQGKSFKYSAIEARIRRTDPETLEFLASRLPGLADSFAQILRRIEDDRKIVLDLEAAEAAIEPLTKE